MVISPGTLTFTWGDVRAASSILVAAATALVARGAPLWPPDSVTPGALNDRYPPGTWRVAWNGDRPAACCCLLELDPPFWPEDTPGEALYLHKLAVHPDHQGQGLAGVMLDDAVQVARQRGVPFLKLDTATDRPKLRALYERHGFQEVGRRHVFGFDVTLYRLPIPRAS